MTRFTRALTASALALSMVLAPTGVAQAQSSLGMSSAATQNSTEQRLRAAAEGAMSRSGHRINESAARQARTILKRALSGDFIYFDGQATYFAPDFSGGAVIYRIPNSDVERVISELETGSADFSFSAPKGFAAGSDDTHHYLVEYTLL